MDNAVTGTTTGASGRYASRTITAMFDSAAEAERAIARLRSAGLPDSAIRHTQGARDSYDAGYRADDQHKGFWESLGDFFFPDEDRYAYAEGLSRGAHMVVVTGYDTTLEDQIVDILDDEGTVDLDAREMEWRSSGWTDYRSSDYYREGAAGADMSTRGTIYDDGMQDRSVQMAADMGRRSQADLGSQQAGYASTAGMAGMGAGAAGTYDRRTDLDEEGTVKVVEENLAVGKRDVDRGAVRIRSYVREEPVSAEVDLRATRVFIERRPVDRPVGAADVQFQDRVIEAREHAEEAVVAKEARVVEEIGLRKEHDVRTETVTDTVRKTEVEIEDERTGETSRITGDGATRGRL